MASKTRQWSYLLLITAIAALLGEIILPNRLPLFTQYISIPTDNGVRRLPAILAPANGDTLSQNPSPITTSAVWNYYQQQAAVFLDARDSAAYLQGHIAGAISLPAHRFMDYLDFLDTLPSDTLIITYCAGEECNASLDLANRLVTDYGFSRVRYYFGGWQEWLKAGHPIHKGAAP